MHKGCTREAQGGGSQVVPGSQAGSKEGMPSAKAGLAVLDGGAGDCQSPIADGQLQTQAVLGGCGIGRPRCSQRAMRAPLYISARIRESGGRISDGNYNR